jgi:hypothetical protein
VPEGVHAFQHLLPLLWRQAVETIELVLQMLPLLRGQVAELGIILQRLFLLLRRQIVMLTQPLSGVTALLSFGGTGHRVRGMFLRMVGLREARSNAHKRQRESRYRDPSGDESRPHFPPHFPTTT